MKKSRRLLVLAALAGGFATSTARAQGMPVIDTQSILHEMQQINLLFQQLQQLQNQMSQLERTYASLTGNRGFGMLANGPQDQAARRYLPPTLESLTNLAAAPVAGYSTLAGRIATLGSQVSTLPSGYYPPGSAAGMLQQASRNQLATNQATAEAAYGAAASRIPVLEGMIANIGTTQDSKGGTELLARIHAEEALIANEQSRLTALLYAHETWAAILQQQADDALKQAGRRSHPPIGF